MIDFEKRLDAFINKHATELIQFLEDEKGRRLSISVVLGDENAGYSIEIAKARENIGDDDIKELKRYGSRRRVKSEERPCR